MTTVKQSLVFLLLVLVGSVQWLGDVFAAPLPKRAGFASMASPAPKVFTSQNGFETFANRFFVHWQDARGVRRRTELTAARYDRLRGAYNRRNAYGAAFSYGPVLAASPATRPMYASVLRFAVCGPALQEIGIPRDARRHPIVVEVQPLAMHATAVSWPTVQTVRCAP